jgi:Ala-tRNA(Pro) deacylase
LSRTAALVRETGLSGQIFDKKRSMTAAHHTRQSLLAQLDAWGIETKTVDHEPLFTVEQSTKVHREVEGAHTKNLFLKDKKGALFLVTADHATQVNLKNLHKKLGCGRLSFGNADLMEAHLGVTPGSVTALAIINDVDHTVTFVLDATLMNAAIINVHPLENTATTSIARDDLLAFVERTGHQVQIVDLESDLVDSA